MRCGVTYCQHKDFRQQGTFQHNRSANESVYNSNLGLYNQILVCLSYTSNLHRMTSQEATQPGIKACLLLMTITTLSLVCLIFVTVIIPLWPVYSTLRFCNLPKFQNANYCTLTCPCAYRKLTLFGGHALAHLQYYCIQCDIMHMLLLMLLLAHRGGCIS